MTNPQCPATPAVLKWAREESGYSLEDVCARFPRYQQWEAGEAGPTYPQLERLGGFFKRPIAVFFFPEPPELPPVRSSFRTISSGEFNRLSPRMRYLLRKAQSFQMSLAELNGSRNPAARHILRDMRFGSSGNVDQMAGRVRKYLGISFAQQCAWPDTRTAFANWRDAVERHGVAIFKDAFREDIYSGFCLYDKQFPVIYVNNSAKTREIFTVFHELAHLLFATSGIFAYSEDRHESRPIGDQKVEAACNRFAAQFLLPDRLFAREMEGRAPDGQAAEQIAGKYCISRESVMRRFLDRKLTSRKKYLEAAERWRDQQGKPGKGGNAYRNKIVYLGENYLRLAFSMFHRNAITERELAEHLDISISHIEKLASYFKAW